MSDAKQTMTAAEVSELAELKERLAAAEKLIHGCYTEVERDMYSDLYFDRTIEPYVAEWISKNPPTDPHLAKLWAKYQRRQNFK